MRIRTLIAWRCRQAAAVPTSFAILLALIASITVTATSVVAGEAEDFQSSPSAAGLLRKAPESVPGAAPVLFPATRAGWQDQIRMPQDVAPYLAFHKAAAMAAAGAAMREEPTPEQDRYDALYYDLDLALDPPGQVLTGTVTARVRIVDGPLTQIVLDLDNLMTVSAVTSGGVAATWSHANDLLTVNLDRPYANGEEATVVVTYSGNPGAGGAFGFDSWAGQPLVWTLSEPFGARTWWPCKDYSHDKADSVDIRVTAPTGMITASNGVLREQTDNGLTSYAWWHEKYPIATYLVSITVYPFYVYSDWYQPAQGDPMEIVFYNFPSSIPEVEPVQDKVKDMLGAFAGMFGEYPFLDEKYGHAEFTWGGGMEHQTCTSLGYFGESVVAHEAAHQWWGDMVTCATFHDIWLNEGFASYCEALWGEHLYGRDGYMAEMFAAQYFGGGTIWVPDLSNWNRIFDSNLSYNKASWVVHMLRGIMGDEVFFQFLSEYYNQYAHQVISTAELEALAEAVSGRDLTAFFQNWIYGEYYPIYRFDWTAAEAGGGWDLSLTVQQLQSWQVFEMPIEVVVTDGQGGQTRFQVENGQAEENYILHVDQEPVEVAVDPDNWILRVVLSPIPEPTFTRSLLLVNGVHWETYGNEIRSAYEDHAFSGDYEIDFWDVFPEPAGGYPSTLPPPRGHGSVPGSIIGEYEAVIWVGNNYAGDLSYWNDSPIYGYLEAGGNVLLMTRMGTSFLAEPYKDYLGISWIGDGTIYDCIAVDPGLTNIGRIGSQNYVSTFTLTVGPESSLLYKAVTGYNPNRGIGVVREPANGGTYNPDGGRFAFLSGRPYRWNHQDLQDNVERVLQQRFGFDAPVSVGDPGTTAGLRLQAPSPNPFSASTRIRFALPAPSQVNLTVWDVAGRRVRTLVNGLLPAGEHAAEWDGQAEDGARVASGVYYLRLDTEEGNQERKLLRLR